MTSQDIVEWQPPKHGPPELNLKWHLLRKAMDRSAKFRTRWPLDKQIDMLNKQIVKLEALSSKKGMSK